MISIIIPTYQQGKCLSRTLESIFVQTYQDYEIIVVDDGSTDGTEQCIEPYREKITFLRNEKNRGRQYSRNAGLARSKGEYVLVCDADIVMQPAMLEKMMLSLEEYPECSFAYSSFYWEWKFFKGQPFSVEELRKNNYINTASLVRRKDHPGFDESINRFQDWDVWLTMAERGLKGVFVPDVLFSLGQQKNAFGISRWLPKILYRIPWKKLGIRMREIEKYEAAKGIVKKKHGLSY